MPEAEPLVLRLAYLGAWQSHRRGSWNDEVAAHADHVFPSRSLAAGRRWLRKRVESAAATSVDIRLVGYSWGAVTAGHLAADVLAGRVQVIDADGNVLRASRPAPEDAPTIIDLASPRDLEDGKGADPDTVHLVARLIEDRVFQEAGLTPTAWVFQRDRGLTVIAQDGPDAVFGDSSNYEFKVEAFEQVLRQLSEREATGSPQVAEVDLRFGRNVVLR